MNPDLESYDGPLPLFPLPRFALLPMTDMPLHIFEPRYRRLLLDTMKDRKLIGMVRIEEDAPDAPSAVPKIRPIGCAGRVTELVELPDGRYNLVLQGIAKFEILAEVRSEPYRAARIRWIRDQHEDAEGPAANGATERLRVLADEAFRARQEEAIAGSIVSHQVPFGCRVNRLVLASRLDAEDFDALLELRDIYARARRLERILISRLESRRRAERLRPLLPEDPRSN